MAASPVKVLSVIALVTAFNAVLIGSTAEAPLYEEPDQPSGGGIFASLEAVLAIVQAVWSVVVLIFDSVTFNIPGAPFWIRFPLATIMGGSLVWSVATLIRGN